MAQSAALTVVGISCFAPLRSAGADLCERLAGTQLLSGIAGGLTVAPNQAQVLQHAPAEAAGVGGGVLRMAQRIAAAVCLSAVLAVYLHAASGAPGDGQPRTGYALASCVCAGLLAEGLLLSSRRGTGPPSRPSAHHGDAAALAPLPKPKEITWLRPGREPPCGSGRGGAADRDRRRPTGLAVGLTSTSFVNHQQPDVAHQLARGSQGHPARTARRTGSPSCGGSGPSRLSGEAGAQAGQAVDLGVDGRQSACDHARAAWRRGRRRRQRRRGSSTRSWMRSAMPRRSSTVRPRASSSRMTRTRATSSGPYRR